MEDNVLTPTSGIMREGVTVTDAESFSPTLLNTLVVLWLQAIHQALPGLVRQRFSTDLRSQTIYSIREEISESVPSLLQELQERDGCTISRANFQRKRGDSNFSRGRSSSYGSSSQQRKQRCCLCYAAGRPEASTHYLSRCPFLPSEDKKYLSRIRDIEVKSEEDSEDDSTSECKSIIVESLNNKSSTTCRVDIIASPELIVDINGSKGILSIDTGAESNLITLDECRKKGVKVEPTSQRANMADGETPMETVGEVHFIIRRICEVSKVMHQFNFNGLVVKNLSCSILAGMPFLQSNDIYLRPKLRMIYIGDCCGIKYSDRKPSHRGSNTCTATILRVPRKICLLPGEYVSIPVPEALHSTEIAVEPRHDSPLKSVDWLRCGIMSVTDSLKLKNDSKDPILLQRHEQLCQVRPTEEDTGFIDEKYESVISTVKQNDIEEYGNTVCVDPGQMLKEDIRKGFSQINKVFSQVFSPHIGCYNGYSGRFNHVINMGPSLPPQRRGRIPLYSKNNLQTLQSKFDELMDEGVFAKPENVGISVEYVSPSFLIAKPAGGHRLVTAFTGISQYVKPQPSISPNVDDVLRQIGQWRFLIKTNLTRAYYQIPLLKGSQKYVGVNTPYRGVYVYQRSVMGLPGSEGALEELLCKILGDLIMQGSVVKLADDLYCGADNPDNLLQVWESVLQLLNLNGMKLSPSKTVICPKSTEVLGWIWEQGTVLASQHRINALAVCTPPETIKGLRSFIGAFKFMSRVLPAYSEKIHYLDKLTAGGKASSEKIIWTEEQLRAFERAKSHLKEAKILTLPRKEDHLQVITDASKLGIASALYVIRNKPMLAGVFSAQLKGSQSRWLPCELEALSIGTSVKHFGPYLIQSEQVTDVLTDSKPCIQAYNKLQRGMFSASSCVTTFLSTISRYRVRLSHLAGEENILSDYFSRNPAVCDGGCQICVFISKSEITVVGHIQVSDILSGKCSVPYATRSTWYQAQQECPVLQEVYKFLIDGRTPSKKRKGIKDVRRYLNNVKLSTSPNDGLLVVPQEVTFGSCRQRIVVPREMLDGLLTALHIQLQHPSKYQMKQVFARVFFLP